MKEYVRVNPKGGRLGVKSVNPKGGRSPLWYGRVPASVSLDSSLSDAAVRVYSILALSVYQTGTASTGMREIGRATKRSRTTAKKRIDELIAAGHVKRAPVKNGERAWYVLTSPVFGQKQRAGAKEVVSCPRGKKRMVSVPHEEIA